MDAGGRPDASATAALAPPAAARELFGAALPLASAYVDMLASQGVEWGLIGPRETERLWSRHVLNSLAVADFVPAGASVVDVGSGAGLPGVPLALARPDVWVTLLEPLERRVRFLELVVSQLGIGERVRVVRARAEEHEARYEVATCRAVAKLAALVAWTAPLFVPGGRLVALKGASAANELTSSSRDLRARRLAGRVVRVSVYPGAEPTHIIVVE